MMYTVVRVYNNGSRVTETFVSVVDMDAHLAYSTHSRFGCAHFRDGKCVWFGYLGEQRCREIEAELMARQPRVGVVRERPRESESLHQAAMRYHRECEAYDQAVCTARDKLNRAMPANAAEVSLVNKNAMSTLHRIASELSMASTPYVHYSAGELLSAVNKASDAFECEWREARASEAFSSDAVLSSGVLTPEP